MVTQEGSIWFVAVIKLYSLSKLIADRLRYGQTECCGILLCRVYPSTASVVGKCIIVSSSTPQHMTITSRSACHQFAPRSLIMHALVNLVHVVQHHCIHNVQPLVYVSQMWILPFQPSSSLSSLSSLHVHTWPHIPAYTPYHKPGYTSHTWPPTPTFIPLQKIFQLVHHIFIPTVLILSTIHSTFLFNTVIQLP